MIPGAPALSHPILCGRAPTSILNMTRDLTWEIFNSDTRTYAFYFAKIIILIIYLIIKINVTEGTVSSWCRVGRLPMHTKMNEINAY